MKFLIEESGKIQEITYSIDGKRDISAAIVRQSKGMEYIKYDKKRDLYQIHEGGFQWWENLFNSIL